MPHPDWYCNSVVFNWNILISARINRNLFFYSIYIDSFSIIPYEFEEYKTKILVKVDERLHLIECPDGLIYESEIAGFTFWKPIADSIINTDPHQVCCSHSKGAVHMGFIDYDDILKYYKFNLNETSLTEIN
ncbi:unnamed protein product [Blepharisma stoltei]|uniref:Uncharacterized protein n=1 Tax=Blepharisma stoltei TaxID=1481888 RepID=A0AAU9KBV1_9CILI|nr:unnamed protein product [Blepharisma stoltei]